MAIRAGDLCVPEFNDWRSLCAVSRPKNGAGPDYQRGPSSSRGPHDRSFSFWRHLRLLLCLLFYTEPSYLPFDSSTLEA